ncbi:MAG TPA: c-type cytochrome, partial [Vicinamibacterales bacterium]|nr:c-type cytochrome [Vicinamibacterales bacterium]
GRGGAPTPEEDRVTAVSGPSWLHRLGVRAGESSLGRGAGSYGPAAQGQGAARGAVRLPIGQGVTITGADIYRFNCQPCHRSEGTGAPPEIKSVLNAVQGSSLALVREQLAAQGKTGNAAEQAAAARADLYRRIQKGGQRMPAFEHLQRSDIDMLYAYLTELVHTPDAKALSSHTVSWVRLGEHLVKGTCHICHDAAGPKPSGQALLQGAVPPLSGFLSDRSVVEVVRKARSGAPIMMGEPPFPHRGRMPVFHYLRDEELAAAYMFLVAYPPQDAARR